MRENAVDRLLIYKRSKYLLKLLCVISLSGSDFIAQCI